VTLSLLRQVLRTDLARNKPPLDRLTVIVFRLGQYAIDKGLLVRTLWRMINLVYVQLLIGAELPPTVQCGPGLCLRHAGRGVILHPDTKMGADVWLYHRVTIGQRGPGRCPSLGDRVYVGTGATIIGPITIGDDAKIGAGAVVTKDVPARCVARGVPAIVVRPGEDSDSARGKEDLLTK
jgi:serine acetyltransferase